MAALVAAALVAVPRALPAEAQDRRPAPPARQDSGGWLGVGLISFSQCPEGSAGAGDDCRHTLVVGGLVHGGPADRAGLQPGDTLLAVDGTRLTEGLEDGVFGRLSPGDTVSILVGRSDGRTRLDAVPASRPDSLAIVQYHQDGAYLEHRARYFLAIPERSVLDSLVEAASRDPNLTVRTRVRVVPTERVKKIPLQSEPEAAGPPRPRAEARERLAEMRARAREIRRRAVEEAREFGREAREAPEPERVGAEEWKRWVSEELQPRLQVIYDSVLTMARGRMDSLRAMYPAVAARAARAMDSLSAAASRSGRAHV